MRLHLIAIAGCALLGVAAPATAQNSPTRSAARQATVTGMVVDSAEHPLANAAVEATDASGKVEGTVRTTADGRFTLGQLPTGAKLTFTARRMGYAEEQSGPTTVPDTGLVLRFVMTRLPPMLATVLSTAPSSNDYRVTVADITSHHNDYITIRGYLARWRPRMLGDRWKNCTGRTQPPLRIYMNGQHAAPWDLNAHMISDVSEMRYFDCWNANSQLRNVLAIDLKQGIAP